MLINKKGDAFALGIVIVTIIVCGVMLYSLNTSSTILKTSVTSQVAINQFYDRQIKFEYYTKEAAKMSEQQALYESAKKGGVLEGACKPLKAGQDYVVIWDNNCNPVTGDTINSLFSKYFNESFATFIMNYPDYDLNITNLSVLMSDDYANLNFDNMTFIKYVENGAVSYSADYTFNPSFSYKMELGPKTFKDIYHLVNYQLDDCKKESSDINHLAPCLNKLIVKNMWKTMASRDGNYLLLNMTTTKKFFFYDSDSWEFKWQPIELRFAIPIVI